MRALTVRWDLFSLPLLSKGKKSDMSHGVFRAIYKGVQTRGDGGFLYVRGDECCYMYPGELSDAGARAAMTKVMAQELAASVYFVAEERDGNMHILAHPKELVMAAAVAASPPAREEVVVEEVVEDPA